MKIFNFTFRIILILVFFSFVKGVAQTKGIMPNRPFMVVENMPQFSGCEQELDVIKRKLCAKNRLNEYVNENLQYPAIAFDNGVEGKVMIRFIVEEDGSLSNLEIIKNIGANCGKEAIRLINNMPEWVPGMQRGKPVRVQMNLPIKFDIEQEKKRRAKSEEREIVHPSTPMYFSEIKENFSTRMRPPTFPGCEDFDDQTEREICAEQKMKNFVKSKMNYPRAAKNQNIEGVVEVEFIIEQDGSISNPKLIKGIGYGCDEEALRIIQVFPKYSPRNARGPAFRIKEKVKIEFKLD